jgi:hypothetical protein
MAQAHQPPQAQPVNPVFSRIREARGSGPAQFSGWVGSGAEAGRTRLHLDINTPSFYVEFSNDDVMHWADVPETVMPLGAKAVWLRGDARVRLVRSVGAKAIQVSRFLRQVSRYLTRASQVRNTDAVRGFTFGAGRSMNSPGQ